MKSNRTFLHSREKYIKASKHLSQRFREQNPPTLSGGALPTTDRQCYQCIYCPIDLGFKQASPKLISVADERKGHQQFPAAPRPPHIQTCFH